MTWIYPHGPGNPDWPGPNTSPYPQFPKTIPSTGGAAITLTSPQETYVIVNTLMENDLFLFRDVRDGSWEWGVLDEADHFYTVTEAARALVDACEWLDFDSDTIEVHRIKTRKVEEEYTEAV
jgi:hypothetical protein